MRRITFLLASAALAVGGFASTATADDTTVCVGRTCVCVYGPGVICYQPPVGTPGTCVAVDLDSDGDAEQICLKNVAS
ncbi:MAG TPA: hypothetical protein VNA20_11425 [Frankiaceae bacterium]|nr:hypothetical protein [Frankiaceae bacterium]